MTASTRCPGAIDRRFIELQFQSPGSVVELRALGVGGRGIRSGYFDSPESLLREAERLDGKARGLFVTLNPVNPALLARARNSVVSPDRTTADEDVIERRWLLIDIDPTRPSGISATECERLAAGKVMQEIGLWLRGAGFPAPVVADSGNGAHLLYRVNLPVKDDGLISGVLAALAFKFDMEAVTVDQAVHNPARLTKLYGTLVKKGDETEDRRHRRSGLIHVPNEITPVARELLEEVAAQGPPAGAPESGGAPAFDVEDFIRRHGLTVSRSGPWKGGVRWVLDDCPFNSDHTDRSAYIIQFSSGALAAGCHHNGCSWSWSELRGKLEPERTGQAGDGPASVEDRWEDPIPLRPTYAPPLPLDVLPQWQADWVEATAESTRSPTDIPYVLSLGVCALSVARKVAVEVLPTWWEPLNIYTCGVAPVSEAKSPNFKAALAPVSAWEAEERRRMGPIIAAKGAEQEILAKRRKQAVEAAAKGGDESEAIAAAKTLSEFTMPVLPQLVAEDASVESLDILLMQQGEKIGVFSAEGTPFEIAAGRFSDRANPEVYLKGWSGDMLRVNRVSREGGLCEMPLLTLGLTVQPDVLKLLGDSLRARGFPARILFAVPQSLVGSRPARSARVPGMVAEGYRSRITSLLGMPWPDEQAPLALTREAEELFFKFRGELEPRLAANGDLSGIGDWAAKTDRQVLRVAGQLHCADRAGKARTLEALVADSLAPETMERAVRLIHAFVPHAKVAFGLMDPKGDARDARYLLDRLREIGERSITRRDLRRKARKFERDADMEPAVQMLCEHGYLRPIESRHNPKGSPKTDRYEVHPSVVKGPHVRAKRAERSDARPDQASSESSGTYGTPSGPPEDGNGHAVPSDARGPEADPEEEMEWSR